ncbi:MAG: hypothetical protein M3065_03360 [Actinomycetota bacterium]|nr:hypothetical protein [Actinomycetota bacterium]
MKALAPVCLSTLVVLLGGCGSSTPRAPASTVSNVSLHTYGGVRFAAEVRIRDKRECFFANFAILAVHTKPFEQTTRSCGPSNQPAGPMLIEVAKPRLVLILDRPTGRCAAVTITEAHGRPIAANTSCSATKPTLRLTRLPPAATVTVHGIDGVTRLALRRYPCSLVCTRPIVAPG